VFLLIVAVVWLGDIVLRYAYHKTRHLICSSKTPAVQYRRENGEEMVSLLEEHDRAVDTEHNESVIDMVNTERPEVVDEVLPEQRVTQTEETIEND